MQGGELPEVPAIVPELVTGYQEGLGFFFRGGDGAGGESLFALRSGMAWGHHHSDDGSIQFYARGRALIIDSASSQPQERGERKVAAHGHSRVTVPGVEPLGHFWRFNRGWLLDAQAGSGLAYAAAGTPTFVTRAKNLQAAPLVRAFWELRAVVELAPAAYLVADYLDASQEHAVHFHLAHQNVTLDGNRVSTVFGTDCRLEIVPLLPVAPPALSLDRPLNPAKIPQEITTAVDYRGVTGSWSLFVIAALGAAEHLNVTADSTSHRVIAGGKNVTIAIRKNDRLEVVLEGEESRVTIDGPALLTQLRAGSR
jgi:hypothetical protein